MSFKKRILEENILKKMDRFLHQDEYQQLLSNIHKNRAISRQSEQEIKDLEKKLAANKYSPQASAFRAELESKRASLRNAKDHLDIYRELGRKGLGVNPLDYKLQKAKNEGRKQGLIAGGLGGTILGSGLFFENT